MNRFTYTISDSESSVVVVVAVFKTPQAPQIYGNSLKTKFYDG